VKVSVFVCGGGGEVYLKGECACLCINVYE